jgi:PAS domain S-box-containing protein
VTNSENIRPRSTRVGVYTLLLALCWTCTVVTSLVWNLHLQRQETSEIAFNVARAYLESDNRYRQWNALQGGVYIPSSAETDFSKLNRFSVPETEITTPAGRKLSLTDHDSMMRQVYKLSGPANILKGELKGLDPLSKHTTADEWEAYALRALENGEAEVGSVIDRNGEKHLRLMRPFIIEKPCLKCHGRQGYDIGDIRGGITITIPISLFGAAAERQILTLWWGHLAWWFLGLLGIWISFMGMRKRIKERELAEIALEKIQREQEQILRAAGEGIYGVDRNGITTFVNPAAANMLGWKPEELIGRNQHETIHHTKKDGNPYPENECPVSASVRDGKIHEGTELYWRKNGTSFPIDFISTPVIENSEIIGAVITFADISLRKQAEKDKNKAQTYLQSIIDSMPSVLVGVNLQGNVTQWNNEAAKVTGFEPHEAYGRQLQEVYPTLAPENSVITKAIEEQQIEKLESMDFTDAEGGRRYADIMIYPLSMQDYKGAVIRIDDVTDRVMMEDRIVQTEKMTSVVGLVEGMAHEINNPLGGIIQGAQNVLRRLSPELDKNIEVADECGLELEKVQEYMEKRQVPKFLEGIRSSGKRASDIISYMLQFSQIHEAPKEKRNLAKLIDNVLEMITTDGEYREEYNFDKIEIVKQYDPDLPDIPCTVSEIEQVMRNLLQNAGQAIADQVSPQIIVRIQFERENNMALVEVQDNGIGMDETVQRRIFEPFFTTKPPGEGTGLGLAVSYFIITVAHQGTMDVQSTTGEGSTFSFRLPMD